MGNPHETFVFCCLISHYRLIGFYSASTRILFSPRLQLDILTIRRAPWDIRIERDNFNFKLISLFCLNGRYHRWATGCHVTRINPLAEGAYCAEKLNVHLFMGCGIQYFRRRTWIIHWILTMLNYLAVDLDEIGPPRNVQYWTVVPARRYSHFPNFILPFLCHNAACLVTSPLFRLPAKDLVRRLKS